MGAAYEPPAASVLQALSTAVWVHGFESNALLWANRAALALWSAESLEALRARDFSDMSDAARARQRDLRERLDAGERVVLQWTFYPRGRPTPVEVTCSPWDADGRSAMLVEARRQDDDADAPTLRALEALRHTGSLIALYGPSGEELFHNPAHFAVFGRGVRFEETVGDRVLAATVLESARGGRPWAGVVPRETPNGRAFHRLHALPTRDPATGEEGLLVNRDDVTASHRAMQIKDELISTVSHELRTPITSIRGALGLLTSEALGGAEKRASVLALAERNVVRLATLVDDLLDVQKLAAGRLSLRLTRVDVCALVDGRVERAEGLAARFGVALTVRHEAGPLEVELDDVRVEQILDNLLSNAAKFSPEGAPITLTTRAEGAYAVVDVRDRGPGVALEAQGRIFEPFVQGDSTDARAFAGTGLGLSISRAIALAHGGSLDVESPPGEGATFSLRLPRAWSDEP